MNEQANESKNNMTSGGPAISCKHGAPIGLKQEPRLLKSGIFKCRYLQI